MFKHIGTLTALGLALALTACGGNSGGGGGGTGGNSGSTPSTSSALVEGAWNGNTAQNGLPTGDSFDMLLLENNTFYAMFRNDAAGATPSLSFSRGSYAVDGNHFAANGTRYNLNPQADGSLSGTVVSAPSGSTISGNSINSSGVTTLTFEVRQISAIDTNYIYDARASLGALAGNWSSAFLQGESGNFLFTIDTGTGALAANNGSCTLTGTVTPRSNGKNVFDVSIGPLVPPCVSAGQTFSGVAISYIASSGKRQFTAALQNHDNSLGVVLYAHQ